MSVGHVVNGVCVDVADSMSAYYSQIHPVLIAGASADTWRVFEYFSAWKLTNYSIDKNSGVISALWSVPLPAPGLASCVYDAPISNLDRFTDGNLMGWAVVAAMVAAWSITVLRRAI